MREIWDVYCFASLLECFCSFETDMFSLMLYVLIYEPISLIVTEQNESFCGT